MATTYPYTASIGGLASTIEKLRKAFPATVTAKTLQQWGFAPKNETYVLAVIRHLGLIDEDGKKDATHSKVFLIHEEAKFQKAFAALVKDNYKELFELHGDDAWTLERVQLISFFRTTDESSATVGQRQARTFQALSGFGGKVAAPKAAPRAAKPEQKPPV